MSRTVELVLAVEPTAASEWLAGPVAAGLAGKAADRIAARAGAGTRAAHKPRGAAARRHAGAGSTTQQPDVATAIADALSRMPGAAQADAFEMSTVRAFIEPRGGWRVLLAAAPDGARRVKATRMYALTPGVWRSEIVCEAPLEPGTPLAFSDALPRALKDALGKADELAPSPALIARRGVWRWTGPDDSVVDIELHDARAAFDTADTADTVDDSPSESTDSSARAERGSAAPAPSRDRRPAPIAFCELRLVACIGPSRASTSSDSSPETDSNEAASTPTTDAGGRAEGRNAPAAVLDERGRTEWSTVQGLFAAATALADVLPVFPTLTDGYARACTRAAGDEPVRAARIDLSHAKTPHDALIVAGASIARQWFGNEAGVRDERGGEMGGEMGGDTDDDTEYVHQMRVALRRLKTLLKTFPRWADETWERAMVPDLDWLGGLLGRARDLDVFVDATLPALAQADIDASAWVPLQARAAASRDDARAQVRAALRTRRYAALSLAWLQWLAARRFSVGPAAMAHKPLVGYAVKRVRKHYRRLIAKPALTSLTPAERHRRRIDAKRLRYTLEFFESLASRKTRREVAKQLGRIQSVLGDGSDATAALHFLEALDVPPYQHGFARGWCEAVNRWSAVEGERLLQALGKPKIVRNT